MFKFLCILSINYVNNDLISSRNTSFVEFLFGDFDFLCRIAGISGASGEFLRNNLLTPNHDTTQKMTLL